MRQAGHAKLLTLPRHREPRDRRLGAHPIGGLPVAAGRQRRGETQARARRLGIRLGAGPRQQQPDGAAGIGERGAGGGVFGGALHHRLQRRQSLRGPIKPGQRLCHEAQRRDLRRTGRHHLERQPAGLQRSRRLGRRAPQLRAAERLPVRGGRVAAGHPIFQRRRDRGPVVAPLGIGGTTLGGLPLRRGRAGGCPPGEVALIRRGIAGDARQVEALTERWTREENGKQQEQAAHG